VGGGGGFSYGGGSPVDLKRKGNQSSFRKRAKGGKRSPRGSSLNLRASAQKKEREEVMPFRGKEKRKLLPLLLSGKESGKTYKGFASVSWEKKLKDQLTLPNEKGRAGCSKPEHRKGRKVCSTNVANDWREGLSATVGGTIPF